MSPSELGDRYAWGELVAEGENLDEYSVKKRTDYTWENYKWNKDGKFEKYGYQCPSSYMYFELSDLPTLLREDDIASQLFGGKWRVPSVAEMEELRDECFWETTNNYMGSGVAGFIVYRAKCDEDKCKFYNHNGNNGVVPKEKYDVNSDAHIFLPSVYNESQRYNMTRYMSNQTNWDTQKKGVWNTFYNTMIVNDVLHFDSRPSCLSNVRVGHTHVYEPMLIRPVCDKQ